MEITESVIVTEDSRTEEILGALRPLSLSWRPERLIATPTPAEPSRRQRAQSATAWAITHRPMGTIVPLSSARGMNSSGHTEPKRGCSQWAKASMEVTSPDDSFTTGW